MIIVKITIGIMIIVTSGIVKSMDERFMIVTNRMVSERSKRMEEIEVTSNRKVFRIFIPKECDLDICNKVEIRGREFALVERGEWIMCGTFMELNKQMCSKCGRVEFRMSDYCPNCGAKMDGKEKDDE